MPLDQNLAIRQVLWMGIACLATFLSLRVHYQRLAEIAWPLYGVVLFLLVVVLLMPPRLGAQRWLSLGALSVQPSELAKLALIVALAHYLKEHRFHLTGLKEKIVPFVLTAIPVALIVREPDLGTGLILIPVLIVMIFVWGFRFKWLLALVATLGVVSPVLYHFLRDYQKTRLWVFLHPDRDPLGAGYTIIQSKIAVGSGGLLGKGFLSGTQSRLEFLPERHTDFIFAVIGEEGGFLAAGMIVLCYWALVIRGFTIAQHCDNRFGRYLASGITTLLAFQALINMGMTIGMFPVVGVPLFLMSYGGSSLIVSMFMIGILVNISSRREPPS